MFVGSLQQKAKDMTLAFVGVLSQEKNYKM